ncbi:hypothetical protein CDL15_Pgr021132 [Punica granatum]|uniref:Uncharacterized protein n=1 Tax=Punica granatum TaxID=22663 RepID=A0A218WJJ9_PUNGR|nr:hypothetical protein CDL15_Pgr021132 [Punica granatum]
MTRRAGACLRCCLVVFAVISALGVCGPALYWKLKKGMVLSDSKLSCPPCVCNCPPPLSLLKLAPDWLLPYWVAAVLGNFDPELHLLWLLLLGSEMATGF